MAGGGVITLLFELSYGIGWALLVFGAWFLMPVIGSAVGPRGLVPSSTAPGEQARSAKRARVPMDMTTPTRQAGCHGN
jgi:hypothetical protein